MNRLQSVVTLALLLCLSVTCAAREWTDRNGNKVRGDFVRVRGVYVQIRVTSIKLINVPFVNLCDEDQAFVRAELKKTGDEHLLDFANAMPSENGSQASNQSTTDLPSRSSGDASAGPGITHPGVGLPPGVGKGPGGSDPNRVGSTLGGPTPGAPFGPGGSRAGGPPGSSVEPFRPGGSHGKAPVGSGPLNSGPTISSGPGAGPPDLGPSMSRGQFNPAGMPRISNPQEALGNNGAASRPRVSGGLSRIDSQPLGRNDVFPRPSRSSASQQEAQEERAERAAAVIGTTVLLMGFGCFAVSGLLIVGVVVLIVHLSKSKPPGPTYYRY